MRIKILATVGLLASLSLVVKANAAISEYTVSPGEKSLALQSIKIAQVPNWKEFPSSSGQFAVTMPGTPTVGTETDEDNGSIYHQFELKDSESFYFIQYWDLPQGKQPTGAEVAEILQDAPAIFVEAANAKLLNSRSIQMASYPGKEFAFAFSDDVTGIGRVYLVKQRVYILVAITPEQASAQKFLTSFRLITKRLP